VIKAALRGWWDVVWMARGGPDWLMLAVDGMLIGLSVFSLVWIARAARARAALMLACQTALLLGVVGWSIGRYPRTSGYSRTETPPAPELDQAFIHLRAQTMPGDGAVVTLFQDDNLAWLEAPFVGPPDIGLPLEAPLRPSSLALLEKTPGWYGRLWVVSRGTLPGDPHNGVEAWLANYAFVGQASQVGDFRMVPYAFAADGLELRDVGRSFGGQGLRLTAYASHLGGPVRRSWLNVWLRWEASQAPPQNYTVFVHLLDPGGRLAAQHDGQPQASYAPTADWPVGMPVDDRHCLLIPADLPPGDYALTVGLYDPVSGQRLPVDGISGDALTLQHVNIPPIDQ
jgi:hypothetical protein